LYSLVALCSLFVVPACDCEPCFLLLYLYVLAGLSTWFIVFHSSTWYSEVENPKSAILYLSNVKRIYALQHEHETTDDAHPQTHLDELCETPIPDLVHTRGANDGWWHWGE
jgi:hypothetical protein